MDWSEISFYENQTTTPQSHFRPLSNRILGWQPKSSRNLCSLHHLCMFGPNKETVVESNLYRRSIVYLVGRLWNHKVRIKINFIDINDWRKKRRRNFIQSAYKSVRLSQSDLRPDGCIVSSITKCAIWVKPIAEPFLPRSTNSPL